MFPLSQGLSLASLQGLQGLQGLQNVQVQIPGLSAPISLSLNVSGAPSGLLVSVPPTTSVVLTNPPSVLSLPIGKLVKAFKNLKKEVLNSVLFYIYYLERYTDYLVLSKFKEKVSTV